MATKKKAVRILPEARRDDFFSRGPTNFVAELISSIQDETGQNLKSLGHAVALWKYYPFCLETSGAFSPNPYFTHLEEQGTSSLDVSNRAISELEQCLEDASHLIMLHAERLGIDSGAIWTSGKLCQFLMRQDYRQSRARFYRPTGREEMDWPGCLGNMRYELTEDQQGTITRGEEALFRLNANVSDSRKWIEHFISGQQQSRDGSLVTRADVAALVHLEKSGMTRFTEKWPAPKAKIARSRAWDFAEIRDLLVEQFPHLVIPKHFTAGEKAKFQPQ